MTQNCLAAFLYVVIVLLFLFPLISSGFTAITSSSISNINLNTSGLDIYVGQSLSGTAVIPSSIGGTSTTLYMDFETARAAALNSSNVYGFIAYTDQVDSTTNATKCKVTFYGSGSILGAVTDVNGRPNSNVISFVKNSTTDNKSFYGIAPSLFGNNNTVSVSTTGFSKWINKPTAVNRPNGTTCKNECAGETNCKAYHFTGDTTTGALNCYKSEKIPEFSEAPSYVNDITLKSNYVDGLWVKAPASTGAVAYQVSLPTNYWTSNLI